VIKREDTEAIRDLCLSATFAWDTAAACGRGRKTLDAGLKVWFAGKKDNQDLLSLRGGQSLVVLLVDEAAASYRGPGCKIFQIDVAANLGYPMACARSATDTDAFGEVFSIGAESQQRIPLMVKGICLEIDLHISGRFGLKTKLT